MVSSFSADVTRAMRGCLRGGVDGEDMETKQWWAASPRNESLKCEAHRQISGGKAPKVSAQVSKPSSNSLIIHLVNTRKITTVNEVWIPDLNEHRFWRLYLSVYSLVFVSIEKIYQTLHRISESSKLLRCTSYFQLSSRCFDIPMKHSIVFDMFLTPLCTIVGRTSGPLNFIHICHKNGMAGDFPERTLPVPRQKFFHFFLYFYLRNVYLLNASSLKIYPFRGSYIVHHPRGNNAFEFASSRHRHSEGNVLIAKGPKSLRRSLSKENPWELFMIIHYLDKMRANPYRQFV